MLIICNVFRRFRIFWGVLRAKCLTNVYLRKQMYKENSQKYPNMSVLLNRSISTLLKFYKKLFISLCIQYAPVGKFQKERNLIILLNLKTDYKTLIKVMPHATPRFKGIVYSTVIIG